MNRRIPEDSLATVLQLASFALHQVMDHGRALPDAISQTGASVLQRAAVQDLAYAAVRQWPLSVALADVLTGGKTVKPIALRYLLLTALAIAADPFRQRYDAHTLVNQAVIAADAERDTRPGKGLVNACLRRFYRESTDLLKTARANEEARWGYPHWWIEHIRQQNPDHWTHILDGASRQPAMTLRVNRRKTSVEQFVADCTQAGLDARPVAGDAVWLPEPVAVQRIPGFEQGHVSVQDLAAQWAADQFDLQDGMRFLDACCAPGGKTGHVLERADLELVGLDSDASRLRRVEDNLRRLDLLSDRVKLKAADANQAETWWDGRPFDAILADVPCSGSGVTRRHPDIRWLRRPEDVASLSQLQLKMLGVLWSVLRPGGTLVLVTCSIFGEEGEHLLARFLERHPDAVNLPAPGRVLPVWQTDGPGHDGFFYARLRKDALMQA